MSRSLLHYNCNSQSPNPVFVFPNLPAVSLSRQRPLFQLRSPYRIISNCLKNLSRSRINQKKRKPEESPHSNMVAIRDLDEEQISPKDSRKKMKRKKCSEGEGSRARENKLTQDNNSLPSCIDKLRDELSCAICLEICYEPTSLWCGHSFCIRCLRLAVIKFGNNCPKCQQDIRESQPYIVNTVVWNTIQLLFPQEVKKVKSPLSNMVVVPDKQQISPKDSGKKMKKKKYSEGEGSRTVENKLTQESNSLPSCIDKLREELSCPICLELLVKPVSTWCGHSFCRGCLHSALIKYGNNCPNCRQIISESLSYESLYESLSDNVNTAILNTIDLLFLEEVEARINALNNEYWTTYHGKHIRFEQEE